MTYCTVSSSLGPNFVPKSIKFHTILLPKNTLETDPFWERLRDLKSVPKWPPKRFKKEWVELGKSFLRPLWSPPASLLVRESPSDSLQELILTSSGDFRGPYFVPLQLKFHSQEEPSNMLSKHILPNTNKSQHSLSHGNRTRYAWSVLTVKRSLTLLSILIMCY